MNENKNNNFEKCYFNRFLRIIKYLTTFNFNLKNHIRF